MLELRRRAPDFYVGSYRLDHAYWNQPVHPMLVPGSNDQMRDCRSGGSNRDAHELTAGAVKTDDGRSNLHLPHCSGHQIEQSRV
jgi:hypothetical protein